MLGLLLFVLAAAALPSVHALVHEVDATHEEGECGEESCVVQAFAQGRLLEEVPVFSWAPGVPAAVADRTLRQSSIQVPGWSGRFPPGRGPPGRRG
jgi:hypothetical protein